MATLPTLRPNGDGTIDTSIITRVGGDGTTYWSCIDEDPSTGQPDVDYVYNSGAAGGNSHFLVTDMPADFQAMETLSVDTYTAVVGRTDDNIAFEVSIYDAAETTLLAGDSGGTQGVLVSGANNPNGFFTTNLTLTSAGLSANKATWDGARIRLNWVYSQVMSKDTYDLRLHAVELNGTYTQSTGTAYSESTSFTATATTATTDALTSTEALVLAANATPTRTDTASLASSLSLTATASITTVDAGSFAESAPLTVVASSTQTNAQGMTEATLITATATVTQTDTFTGGAQNYTETNLGVGVNASLMSTDSQAGAEVAVVLAVSDSLGVASLSGLEAAVLTVASTMQSHDSAIFMDGIAISSVSNVTASDTFTSSTVTTGTAKLALKDIIPTGRTSDHFLRVRAWVTSGSGTLKIELREATTLIQSFEQALTTTPTEYELEITNAAAITDYSVLESWLTLTAAAGTSVRVSRVEFSAPGEVSSVVDETNRSVTITSSASTIDSYTATESPAITLSSSFTSTDLATFTGLTSLSATATFTATDDWTLTEALEFAAFASVANVDQYDGLDAVVSPASATVVGADVATFTEASRGVSLIASVLSSDTMPGQDEHVTLSASFEVAVTDSAIVSESLTTAISVSSGSTDTVLFVETVTTFVVVSTAQSDQASFIEACDTSIVATCVSTDDVNTSSSEHTTVTVASSIVATDTLSATDTLAVSASAAIRVVESGSELVSVTAISNVVVTDIGNLQEPGSVLIVASTTSSQMWTGVESETLTVSSDTLAVDVVKMTDLALFTIYSSTDSVNILSSGDHIEVIGVASSNVTDSRFLTEFVEIVTASILGVLDNSLLFETVSLQSGIVVGAEDLGVFLDTSSVTVASAVTVVEVSSAEPEHVITSASATVAALGSLQLREALETTISSQLLGNDVVSFVDGVYVGILVTIKSRTSGDIVAEIEVKYADESISAQIIRKQQGELGSSNLTRTNSNEVNIERSRYIGELSSDVRRADQGTINIEDV